MIEPDRPVQLLESLQADNVGLLPRLARTTKTKYKESRTKKKMHSALILMIDQLSASMLGPYGNTTIETANFNRLASQAMLFDFAFADSVELSAAYDSLWSQAALTQKPLAENPSTNLLASLANAGVETILITDQPELADHAGAAFDRILAFEAPPADRAATHAGETQLAHFFAQATAWLSTEWEPGQLVWLHSRGLNGAWDAPYQIRELFAGDDDPPPPRFVQPPATWIAPNELDPDQILGWQQAAAAQVLLLDEYLGVLLDLIDASPNNESLMLAVAAPRGCPLGEHGLVGAGSQLYGESVHVPLLVRLPDQAHFRRRRVGRSGALVQLSRLPELIGQWLNDRPENENDAALNDWLTALDQVLPDRASQYVLISSNEQESLQTHAWKLIRSKMGGVELFAKPDDRCEVNDVSDRCPEVVAAMIGWLDQLLESRSEASSLGSISLPDELVQRVD